MLYASSIVYKQPRVCFTIDKLPHSPQSPHPEEPCRAWRLEGRGRSLGACGHPSRLAISAFTRVFDALWLAPQDEISV